jgi:hypothetical protein
MLQNAYGEGKQVSARIRASAQSVQMTENTSTDASPLAGEVARSASGGTEMSTGSSQLSLVESVQ